MNIRSWSRARIAAMAVASLLLPAPGAFIAQAQPAANAQTRASIETDLVEVQALDRLIDYYRVSLREPGEALAPLRNSKGGIDIDASWRKAVDGVFAAGGFARKLAQHQAAALSEAEAREIVSFRRSSLGGKLTAAEVTSPFPPEKLGDTAYLLGELDKSRRALGKDKVRAKILADLLQAAGGGAVQAELMLTITRGMSIGMAHATPDGQGRPAEADIIEATEGLRPKFIAMMGAIATSSLALSYRQLTNAELRAYLEHLKSPLGRKNIAGVVKSLAIVLNQASTEIGRAFGRELNAQRS